MFYSWENVYSYDKEFHHHIARYPYRSWSVILQQTWTMLLKDRIKYDNGFQRNGNHRGNKGNSHKEICKWFNCGKCTFGLSCKFDHRCAIPKCGKFGHGAHICCMRNQDSESSGYISQESNRNANNNNNATSINTNKNK